MSLVIFEKIKSNQSVEKLSIIEFLQQIGVFKVALKCENDQNEMSFVSVSTLSDEFAFQCHFCNKRVSIRVGSMLFNSKHSLYEILGILCGFVSDISVQDLSNKLFISKVSVGKWYKIFRSCITNYLNHNFVQLGGPNKIIEIDESVIGRRKYNAGRMLSQQWLFGCIERYTSKIFIKCVDSRTKRELGELIKEVIAEDTTVMSDEWPAYMSFFAESEQYKHLSVNHSRNFIDPVSGAHTQNIERVWGKLKLRLRSKNYVRRKLIGSYIDKFCFRERFKKDECPEYYMFIEILKLMKN